MTGEGNNKSKHLYAVKTRTFSRHLCIRYTKRPVGGEILYILFRELKPHCCLHEDIICAVLLREGSQ
jgi:hypothetical protein